MVFMLLFDADPLVDQFSLIRRECVDPGAQRFHRR